MNRGGRDLKVSLYVGFGGRPPVDLGVVVNEGEKLPLPWRVVGNHSEFPLEYAVEDGRKQCVVLGGDCRLERFQFNGLQDIGEAMPLKPPRYSCHAWLFALYENPTNTETGR